MIPKSIRELMKFRWKTAQREFDRVRLETAPERWNDPSVYCYGSAFEERDNNGLMKPEVEAIHKDGGFGVHSQRQNGLLVVNDHAQHALMDLMSDMQEAWDKYQERLKMILDMTKLQNWHE